MNQKLLVEGNDDLHVFFNIFVKHHVVKSFDVSDETGIDNLYKSLPVHLKTDISTLGVVVDADVDNDKKWRKLVSVFTKHGYSLPQSPEPTGTIVTKDNSPTIGIWIMPNNTDSGMLEDFVKYLVPCDDDLMPRVGDILDSIEADGLNKYKLIHRTKAEIHTWLAWQDAPGTPMGLAIKKTYLDANHDLCVHFVKWVNDLFN